MTGDSGPEAEISALADQQRELDEMLEGRPDSDWELPSRCEGWRVADVMVHLAQSGELAAASVGGTFDAVVAGLMAGIGSPPSLDEAIGMMVAAESGLPIEGIRDRWRTASSAQLEALRASDPHARVPWAAGRLSARTLVVTRLAETWIHTGDVAWAFGLTPEPTERLEPIARLAWRTLPHAFGINGLEIAGPVAFHLTGPGGEAWDLDPDEPALTTVTGPALELCEVAARRRNPGETSLVADGPDAAAVLDVVRTWA